MQSKILLGAIAVAGFSACGTAALDDGPGRETGPCIESQCFDGLSCRDELCVDDPGAGESTSDVGTSGPSTNPTSAADSADDSGEPDEGATAGDQSDDPAGSGQAATTQGDSADAGEDEDEDEDEAADAAEFSEESDEGSSFIDDPPVNDCSIWEQDCPPGEKCNAFAAVGGTWDATGCFDVANSPNTIGQACTTEGIGNTGVDSCVEGAICWDVDQVSFVGECVGYCEGDEANPQCPTGTTCAISNGGVIALCLPTCDPTLQNCPAGQGCYPINDAFACAPDVSDGAGFGDSCAFINTCSPGTACLEPEFVGACAGNDSCCTPACDLDEPNTCPGAGQECVAWYVEGEAPPGADHIGFCGFEP